MMARMEPSSERAPVSERLPSIRAQREAARGFARDERAALEIDGGLKVVAVVISAVIVVTILAALVSTYASSVKKINANLTSADFGDTTANSIADIFPLVLGIIAVVALVGLALAAFSKFSKGGD